MSALIVLVYYERPKMIRYALQSLVDLTTDRWHLAFIDDGSRIPGRPVVEETLPADILARTTFYSTGDSVEQKKAQNGSRHGEFMTRAIRECPGDVVVILCDDDAMLPGGLAQLLEWYEERPDAMYSWSRVREFSPFAGPPSLATSPTVAGPNRHQGSIKPACQVDSSQVTFRASAVRDDGCHYPFIGTCALDAALFVQLEEKYGLCPPTDIELQYKANYPDQMGRRPVERMFEPHDLP